MNIAKIVKSNSHIDYIGRIIDELDTAEPPKPQEYGFGQFVSIRLEDKSEIIGVIYDSILVNPDYASYGPRLSSKSELQSFSPDHLNEQGILVGILLLGTIGTDGNAAHGIPHRIIPPGLDVSKIEDEKLHAFHRDATGSVQIHYYSQLVTHAGNFAIPLIESIIGQISEFADDSDKKRLNVLRQSLSWQRTMGGMRL